MVQCSAVQCGDGSGVVWTNGLPLRLRAVALIAAGLRAAHPQCGAAATHEGPRLPPPVRGAGRVTDHHVQLVDDGQQVRV